MFVKELDYERWYPLNRFQAIEGTPENLIGCDGDERVKLDHFAWHPDLVGAQTVPAAQGTWLLDASDSTLQRYAVVAWTIVGCRAYPALGTAVLGRVDDLRHQRAILHPDGHVEVVGLTFETARVFPSLGAFEDALPELKAEWAEDLAAHQRRDEERRAALPNNVVAFRRT